MGFISSSLFSMPDPISGADYLPNWRQKKRLAQKAEKSVFDRQILVVEDDAELSEVYKLLRWEKNWPLDIAKSSSEALSMLSKHPYDVVILDWNLPDFNGDALVRVSDTMYDHHAKKYGYQILKKTPIITFSSEPSLITTLPESKYFFRYDHWNKPFKIDQVTSNIETLLRAGIEAKQVDV